MKKLRKISVLLLSIIMALGSALTVFAASDSEVGPSIIDTTQQGSITITKNNGTLKEGSSTEYNPLAGVTYTLYKVATIEQGSVTNGKVSVSYNSRIANLTITGETGVAELEAALNDALNKEELKIGEKTTNSYGIVEFTELELGIYLAVETAYPSMVVAPNSFIVSVPMTNAAGNAWIYDIDAEPKNTLQGEPQIDKSIIVDPKVAETPVDDVLSKAEDYNIGDTVPYHIKAGVPVSISKLAVYKITDELSAGLTYTDDSIKVYGAKTENGTETATLLGENIDYKLGVSGQEISINFYTTKLAGYENVYVTFDAKLNEKAAIYQSGNPNDVKLEYSHSTSIGSKPGDGLPNEPGEGESTVSPVKPPIVYTYKIQIKKISEDEDATALKEVEFELQDANGNKIDISEDETGYYVKAGGTETLKTDVDGQITIRGLDDGIYFIVETKAAPDYTLLAKPIEIYIKSDVNGPVYTAETADDIGDYFKIEAGKDYYVEQQDGKYAKIDLTGFNTGDYVSIPGVVLSVDSDGTVNAGSDKVEKLVRSTAENGINSFTTNANPLTVTNKKGYVLPGTGGMGTMMFKVIGIAIIGLAGAMLLVYYKKRKQA